MNGHHLSSDHVRKHVGKMLREKRLEKNYSLAAVAADLGMSKSSLSEIENGDCNTPLEKLEMIAAYFGVSMTDILPPPLKCEVTL
jgi:transcriptional regulator with XRE-family HTH domain